jgi:hypothetical protein
MNASTNWTNLYGYDTRLTWTRRRLGCGAGQAVVASSLMAWVSPVKNAGRLGCPSLAMGNSEWVAVNVGGREVERMWVVG